MTREEFIDIVYSELHSDGDNYRANRIIDAADEYAEEQTRWIPVSEKLPEDGLYLVTTSKGQVQVHVFNHNGNSEEYWMRCNKAWMPLPEPYKASPAGGESEEV